MGANLVELPDELEKRRTCNLFDNLDTYVDAQLWTKTLVGTATVAASDNVNGLVTCTTGAVLNQSAAFATTRANWLYQNMKPILYEARINYAEANTNKAGVAVGLADAFGTATLLTDTTLVPRASFSGALIYKMLNETSWRVISSLGATQTINLSGTSSISTADQVLRIEIKPVSSTVAEVTFWVNGVQLSDAVTGLQIKHNVTYAGAVKMQVGGGFVKAGSGSSEVLNVDYVGVAALR
jgi:hypothetical protein